MLYPPGVQCGKVRYLMERTHDLRISSLRPLIAPAAMKKELPMTEASNKTVIQSRIVINDILAKKDKRLLALIGPCSIHDIKAAEEYASRLLKLAEKLKDRIYIVMRVYFEKPRSTIGWRGLIVDPYLDGSYRIEDGVKLARRLLLSVTQKGLPAGSEMLDPIVPQYIDDCISWASIGARTTESQTHRNLASGLSMPVGFKNSTSGSIQTALDALTSAIHPHSFIGIDHNGQTCILDTTGNQAVHLIMRGGKSGPNYYEENVEKAEELFRKASIEPAIMIDCSHANSGKKHERQERVLNAVLDQRCRGRSSIIGIMLESNLKEGQQDIPRDISALEYGKSVTDACIGWEKTEELLNNAYEALG